MRLFKLRVVDANSGQRIGIGRAVARYIGLIIAALPCWIGLIWAAFDPRADRHRPRRRPLHRAHHRRASLLDRADLGSF